MPRLERWNRRIEATVAHRAGSLTSAPSSPERVNILARAVLVPDFVAPPAMPENIPNLAGSLLGIKVSFDELEDNPPDPRTTIDAGGIRGLEAFARQAGALSIGYAEVPRSLVFRGKAVLHSHAIVLAMEMDKARIDTAPSRAAGLAVHETYNRLGRVSNEVARYLRRQGFSAHAGHPLNGLVLYPPLAEAAHLGGRGMHGLLITPEMGPTIRLAAVFTSIENLPMPRGDNPHGWVTDFCDVCRLCVRRCPVDAIREQPIVHADGRVTCVDDAKCLPFFATHHGCSICVAVCPFNTVGYDRLHRWVLAHGHSRAVARAAAGTSDQVLVGSTR